MSAPQQLPRHPFAEPGRQAGIPPGLFPGSQTGASQPAPQTGAKSGPEHAIVRTATPPFSPISLPPLSPPPLMDVPKPPKWKNTLDAKETVNSATFVHEHKEWLDKLLLPTPPLAELLPKIFEHITKDTIRVLPARYNDKLFEIFRRMGDSERRDWCIQNSIKQTVVPRKILVPRSINQAQFVRATQRLWEIGHNLNCREIPEGREIERLAWELMGLHESIAFNWITLYRERAILKNMKTPIYFPSPPPPRPRGQRQQDNAAGRQAGVAGLSTGSPVQRPANVEQIPANTGQLPLPGNGGQPPFPGIVGQLPLPGNAGQLPLPGLAGQLPLPGNAGQFSLSANARQLPLPGNAGQLAFPGNGQLAFPVNDGQLQRSPFPSI
ncbi:hypothetical protein EDB81DRAFT_92902 [Dactylonectria macrodidyma]|uniref:Uncharacterized protein n=1 Tax=Dactylonectria macrodidyma TaxID=307937 RepID=A0A9P9IX37_9HYPO|nr:hypothetical protein EDB81DRAFT_92902 [Dactylonectria macrodidyma]